MIKRFFSILLCCILSICSAAALSGCGKDKDDLIQQGLTYIENGQYERARSAFQEAAQNDPEDTQAKECYQIVDAYLKAEEAHALGDDEAAAEYLADLPERYQNLAIAEDIDSLLRSLRSSLPDAENREDNNEEDTSRSTERPERSSATEKPAENETIFSAQENIASQLQSAKSQLDAGLYDDVLEILNGLDMTYATTEQKNQYNEYKEQAESGKEQAAANDAAHPEQADFTAEKALEYLQAEYPIQGDLGELPAKYDENNRKYYEILFAYNGENITVRIFADGTIERVN